MFECMDACLNICTWLHAFSESWLLNFQNSSTRFCKHIDYYSFRLSNRCLFIQINTSWKCFKKLRYWRNWCILKKHLDALELEFSVTYIILLSGSFLAYQNESENRRRKKPIEVSCLLSSNLSQKDFFFINVSLLRSLRIDIFLSFCLECFWLLYCLFLSILPFLSGSGLHNKYKIMLPIRN